MLIFCLAIGLIFVIFKKFNHLFKADDTQVNIDDLRGEVINLKRAHQNVCNKLQSLNTRIKYGKIQNLDNSSLPFSRSVMENTPFFNIIGAGLLQNLSGDDELSPTNCQIYEIGGSGNPTNNSPFNPLLYEQEESGNPTNDSPFKHEQGGRQEILENPANDSPFKPLSCEQKETVSPLQQQSVQQHTQHQQGQGSQHQQEPQEEQLDQDHIVYSDDDYIMSDNEDDALISHPVINDNGSIKSENLLLKGSIKPMLKLRN